MTVHKTPTCNYSVVLHGTSHNHDGVVKGTLGLLNELLGPSPQQESARLGLGTACEKVIPARQHMLYYSQTFKR